MNVIIIIIISIQLCIYKYVIPWKDLKTGSHVRYKCKSIPCYFIQAEETEFFCYRH